MSSNRFHLILNTNRYGITYLMSHPLHCRGKYSLNPLELTSLEKIHLINCTYTSSNYKDTTYSPLNIYCIHFYWPATSYCQLLSTQPSYKEYRMNMMNDYLCYNILHQKLGTNIHFPQLTTGESGTGGALRVGVRITDY